jgi:hypothetical protein
METNYSKLLLEETSGWLKRNTKERVKDAWIPLDQTEVERLLAGEAHGK